MTVYVGLLTIFFFLSWVFRRVKYKQNYIYLIIFFSILALVIGLRGIEVGEDTASYINIAKVSSQMEWKQVFQSFPQVSWSRIDYGMYGYTDLNVETMFLAFTKLIMQFFGNAQIVLLVISIVTCFFFARFIQHNTNNKEEIYIACFIFLCESMFMNCFNGIRQMLALSIGIQSFYWIKNKEYKKSVIWIMMATLLHLSAMVYLLLIPLHMIKSKKKHTGTIILICGISSALLIIFSVVIGAVFPVYAAYFTQNYWNVSLGGTTLIWILIIYQIIRVYKNEDANDNDYFLPYIMIVYITFEIISLRISIFSRFALYFRVFVLLFFAKEYVFVKFRYRKLFLTILFTLLIIAYLSYASSGTRIYSFFNF